MCGFIGCINTDRQKTVDIDILLKMNNALIHRGPDDEGHFINGNVGIAHRRLSIIDLSEAGRQPITNENKKIFVVFNGEIYNFKELRARLSQNGHIFSSNTDCEVIPHAYEEWGIDFIKKLDGMFAFALYDTRSQTIILAKDPFGKKPLYYYLNKNAFLFASELKAFSPHPEFSKSIDFSSFQKYLAYDYIPTPYTIFSNCYKLPQGNYLIIDTKNPSQYLKPIKYWQLKFEPKLTINENEAEYEIKRLLNNAVKKRLVSDVPLGVFLSGGIDSSCIVALMSELLPKGAIQSFNISFSDKSFDESKYAKLISERFQTKHRQEVFSYDAMLDLLPNIIKNMDEPFADPSLMPTFLLSKFTRNFVTVALSGDGGDELFAGYDTFIAAKFGDFFSIMPEFCFKFAKSISKIIPKSDNNLSSYFKLKHFLKGYLPKLDSNELRNNIWLGSFTLDQQKLILNKQRLNDQFTKIYEPSATCTKGSLSADRIDRIIDNFVCLYLHDDILPKVDKASMANSLEVRAPFLDKDFSEFVSRLPSSYKMKGLARKYLIKKAFKNILPKEILNRPKKGFGIPTSSWISGPLKNKLYDLFNPTNIEKAGFLNYSGVLDLLNNHIKHKDDNRKEIWSLMIFELWRKYHDAN